MEILVMEIVISIPGGKMAEVAEAVTWAPGMEAVQVRGMEAVRVPATAVAWAQVMETVRITVPAGVIPEVSMGMKVIGEAEATGVAIEDTGVPKINTLEEDKANHGDSLMKITSREAADVEAAAALEWEGKVVLRADAADEAATGKPNRKGLWPC